MHYEYTTKGTCSRTIFFDIEEGKLHNVQFIGGCNGNLKGISRLLKGMKAEDAIARMDGVAQVSSGGRTYAMRIWLDPVKLSGLNVSISEIKNAIEITTSDFDFAYTPVSK